MCMCGSFNFVISNESNFYDIPYTNIIYILVLTHIVIEQMLSSTVRLGTQPRVQCVTV